MKSVQCMRGNKNRRTTISQGYCNKYIRISVTTRIPLEKTDVVVMDE